MSANNWAELEKQVYGASFSIGTETTGDAVTVAVQLTDRKGLNIAYVASGIGYLSSDAAGTTPVGIPTSITNGTDGGIVTIGTVSSVPAAFLWVSEVDGDIEKVAEALSKFPETDYVVITAGSFDILCEVVCDDDDSLLELINRRIRALPGVRRTESFMYLTFAKHVYTYGTR